MRRDWPIVLVGFLGVVCLPILLSQGCAALTDRPASWGPPIPCSQDPSCEPPLNDDAVTPLAKRRDAGR